MNKNNFDILRFIFAFIVLWEHIIALAQNKEIMYLEDFFEAYSSVTGFFIISGFLISKSYKSTGNLYNYLIKRAKRLFPAYLLAIFSGAIFFAFISSYSLHSYFGSKQFYSYMLANLTFLNFLQPNLPGVFESNPHTAVNGALWTLKVEVLFYLSLPIVLYYVDKSKQKFIPLIIIYVLSVTYKTLLGVNPESFTGFLSRQTPGFYCYFIAGISFYYYYDFYTRNIKKILIFTIPIFIIEFYFGSEFLRPFCYAMIIFYLAYNFPMFNKFGKYGDFSYGMYIYHWPIIQVFVYYKFFERYNPYLVSFTITFIVLFLSLLSWHFVEKPFLKKRSLPDTVPN